MSPIKERLQIIQIPN